MNLHHRLHPARWGSSPTCVGLIDAGKFSSMFNQVLLGRSQGSRRRVK
jgi:hypothetical protein